MVAWDTSPADERSRGAALANLATGGAQPGRGQLGGYLDPPGDGHDVLGPGAAGSDAAFAAVRNTLARHYQLAIVDSGTDGETWQRVVDASDQLLVIISAASGASGSAAVRLLDQLERDGQRRLVRHAVTVITAAAGRFDAVRRDSDLSTIQGHFGSRTRVVHVVPHDKVIASAGPTRFEALSAATRTAWLRIAADIANGL